MVHQIVRFGSNFIQTTGKAAAAVAAPVLTHTVAASGLAAVGPVLVAAAPVVLPVAAVIGIIAACTSQKK